MQPHILAATGQLGPALAVRLAAIGIRPIAVARDPAKLAPLYPIAETRVASFDDPDTLTAALADATHVVACGNAVHLPRILAALPASVERVVAMGSTRVFSTVPDATSDAVREAELLLQQLPFPTALLLSSPIYGGGIGVLEQLVSLGRRLPAIPVPVGVRVQPIHRDDVVLSLEAALARPEITGSITIAGPQPMRYGEMVRRTLASRGISRPLLPVPRPVLMLAASMLGRPALARLAEDGVFDVSAMCNLLGVIPRPFDP